MCVRVAPFGMAPICSRPKLSFIEVKYGDGALSGKAGMEKHIEDFKKYKQSRGLTAIKNEMKSIFAQKRCTEELYGYWP